MRIAILGNGLHAHHDACYRALSDIGNELLLVYPEVLHDLPYDRRGLADYAQRHVWHSDAGIWKGEPPPAEVMVPLVRDFQPDVVIMMSWRGKGYRSVMRDQKGKALRVLYSENIWHSSAKQWLGRATHRFYVNPLYDCAFVPSDRAEWFVHRLGFTPDRVIRGALTGDVELFERGPRTGEELAGRRRFLYSGRLVDHKNPDILALAYARYRGMVDDPWDLAIVGQGPLASVFDGIDGVTLLGFRQPAEVVDEMHQSSSFILPSWIDFYGVSVHEAATAGLPLLLSDGVGAVTHFLQDGFNGWTVAPGDVDGLADAMRRMSTLGPDRLGAMSDGSRCLARRLSPKIYATNLHEEAERRCAAMGLTPAGVSPDGRRSRRPGVDAASVGR